MPLCIANNHVIQTRKAIFQTVSLGSSVNKEGRIASSCSFSGTHSFHESCLVPALLLRILPMLVLFAVNQPLQNQTRFIRVSSPFAAYYTTL